MTILKTFIVNYSYGTFLGILKHDSFAGIDHKKAYLNYYEIKHDGTTTEINKCSKETLTLEKQASRYLEKENYFILWTY